MISNIRDTEYQTNAGLSDLGLLDGDNIAIGKSGTGHSGIDMAEMDLGSIRPTQTSKD